MIRISPDEWMSEERLFRMYRRGLGMGVRRKPRWVPMWLFWLGMDAPGWPLWREIVYPRIRK